MATPGSADDAAEQDKPSADKYLLRYKFQPGELMRWKVVHQALVRTTVSGTTQTAETRSESIKVWQVKDVDPKTGQATFVHSVASVDMRQSVSGRQDVRYNSETDVVVPAEFDEVAKAVGVPLSEVVLDCQGHVIKRHEERVQPNANPGEMTVPLPEKPVAIGESWSFPHDASVRQKDGTIKTVKTRQEFKLTEVEHGVATIRVDTVVLTPIRDPALEAQLIQHVTDGNVRFDIDAGRVLGQQTDIDKRVIGFQGEASSLHYVTRFTEEWMPQAASTTAKVQKAGADATRGDTAATQQTQPADGAESIAANAVADASDKNGADGSGEPVAAAAADTAANPSAAEKAPATSPSPAVKPANAKTASPKAAGKTTGKPSSRQTTGKQKPKPKTGNRPANSSRQVR